MLTALTVRESIIPLIDANRDASKLTKNFDPAVKMKWEMKQGELYSNNAAPSVLQIPYQPPEEYDFKIVFTRLTGVDMIGQILVANTHQFHWTMGNKNNKFAGFESQEGFKGPAVPFAMENGQKYTSVVEVRRSGVKGYVDGKLLSEYRTDYFEMSLSSYWKIPNPLAIGVTSWGNNCVFHSIELIEIGTKGVNNATVPTSTGAAGRVDVGNTSTGEKHWISKNATYTASSTLDRFDPQPTLLNGESATHRGGGDTTGFSFHTKDENDAHIVIDLGGTFRIDSFEVMNRNNRDSDDRARTLTMWVSESKAGPWKEVWRTIDSRTVKAVSMKCR